MSIFTLRSLGKEVIGTLIVVFLALSGNVGAASLTLALPGKWQQLPAGYNVEADTRPVAIVEMQGHQEPFYLPATVATSLLYQNDQSQQQTSPIQVRDNRYHQGLLRFDLSALPGGSSVVSAKLQMHIQWLESRTGARLELFPLLHDWAPEANWYKPFPEAEYSWNGMQEGVHFSPQPAAFIERDSWHQGLVSFGGLERIFQAWYSGRQANHGLAIMMSGPALQFNFSPASESVSQESLRLMTAGGEEEKRAVFEMDAAVVRRLILKSDDILDAQIALTVLSSLGKSSVSRLSVDRAPESSVSLNGNVLTFTGLGSFLKRALAEGEETISFTISGPRNTLLAVVGPQSHNAHDRPVFRVNVTDYKNHQIFEHPVRMQPNVYVEARDGRFYYGDQRLRLWGTLGHGDVQRVRLMGFNAWRMWPAGGRFYGEVSIRNGSMEDTVQGSGSALDQLDRNVALFKENGIFLMATQLMGVMPPELLIRDDSFVAGGDDWEDWKAAVQALPASSAAAGNAHFRRLAFFDERVRRARFQHAENILNRVNPYTGKRYAEEEAVAIWELDNELEFIRTMMRTGGSDLPPFFQNQLKERWNRWLSERYRSNAAILEAWGELKPGEALGGIDFAPSSSQVDEYPEQRASDYVRFLIELTDSFYQDLRTHCRAQAPEGIGVAVVPFSFDTQYRPSIPWLYSQTRSDVANFGMYFWNTDSLLTRRPGFYVMDSSSVEGKPTVLYEVNHSRPSPYRAEFPYRLAALASWQDWDAVFFHYWGARDRENDEAFMVEPMKYMTLSHYWDAVHHDSDPVMTSAMATAGRIFLTEAIQPAPDPVVYRVGSTGIFGFRFEHGLNMRADTINHGAVIRFEPDSEFDLERMADGAPSSQVDRIQAGNVTWDWPGGRLIIDSPGAKAYVGPAPDPSWTFSDGTTLSGVSSPWLAFGVVALHREPDAQEVRHYVSAVSNAENTGFRFDWSENRGPVDMARAIDSQGTAPVVVDKVDYSLSFPYDMSWQATSYDFALREIARANGQSNVIRLRNERSNRTEVLSPIGDQEAWMTAIDLRASRRQIEPVIDDSPGRRVHLDKGGEADGTDRIESTDPALAGVWNPIEGLSWGDSFALTLRKMRDARFQNSGVSAPAARAPDERTIIINDAVIFFERSTDVELTFLQGEMVEITATFAQPPELASAIQAIGSRLGEPEFKAVSENPFEQSTVRWVSAQRGEATITTTLTSAQGLVKLNFSIREPSD